MGGGGRGDGGDDNGEGVSSEVSSKESSKVYHASKAANSPSDMGDKGSCESSGLNYRLLLRVLL